MITALRDGNGELVGFAKVTRDLTERRALEEERIQRARAEEAIRLRDDFLSLASHELKTPLTVLQMQLDTLHRRLDASDEKVSVKLQRASQSSERLANLVESLLDVSRLASGKFELEPKEFDFTETVSRLVEGVGPAAARARCELRFETRGPVVGFWDQPRLEQVVTNLLSNAVKYGAGKPIQVAVHGRAEEVVLEVRDHGPGIPDAELERLFHRFERATPLGHYGGLGLGLYLIREIVDAHGGSVIAENPDGGGALFRVCLPLRVQVTASTAATEASARN